MKFLRSLGILLATGYTLTALAATIAVTRVETSISECRGPTGAKISTHSSLEDAQTACTNEALKNPGAKYTIHASDLNLIATADANPVVNSGGKGGTSSPNVPSPPADLLAPTSPSRLIATPGINKIDYTWNQSVDNYDGATAGSGLTSYILNLNGVDQAPITAGVASNIRTPCVKVEVGTSGSTYTQSVLNGNDNLFTGAAPTGLALTDAFQYCYWTVTGDFTITTQVASLTSGGSPPGYAWSGVIARVDTDSPDSTERYKAFGQYIVANNRGLVQQGRATAGGVYSQFCSVAGANSPAYVQIVRVANLWTYNYTFDGSTWASCGSETAAFPSTIRIGAFLSSYSATSIASLLHDLKYTQSSDLAYTYNIAAPATIIAKVKAKDASAAQNLSAYSATVTASPTSTAPSTADFSWHPGHYLRPGGAQGFADMNAARDQVYAILDEEPRFAGAMIQVPWGLVETSKNVYNFSQIDRDLAIVQAKGKRLAIELTLEWFHVAEGSNQFLPQYLVDEGGVLDLPEGSGVAHFYRADLNSPAVIARLIALYNALGAHYDAEPYFELITFGETASMSCSQWPTAVASLKAAFPHKNVILPLNFCDGNLVNLAAAVNAANMGIGGPDTRTPPMGEDHGSRLLRGAGIDALYGTGGGPATDFGSIDYRPKMPVAYEYEALGNVPPSAIIGYINNTLKSTHQFWATYKNAWYPSYCGPNPELCYENGIHTTLNSTNFAISTACPTNYLGRCTTP